MASETGMEVISAISCYCEVIPRSSQLTGMHIDLLNIVSITVNEREIHNINSSFHAVRSVNLINFFHMITINK